MNAQLILLESFHGLLGPVRSIIVRGLGGDIQLVQGLFDGFARTLVETARLLHDLLRESRAEHVFVRMVKLVHLRISRIERVQ